VTETNFVLKHYTVASAVITAAIIGSFHHCYHVGTTQTHRNKAHDEIKRKLNSGNYYSVQKLSSHLLSETLKIKIEKLNILTFVLYGCETLYYNLGGRGKVFFSLSLTKYHAVKTC
jgi:hypothetical protein